MMVHTTSRRSSHPSSIQMHQTHRTHLPATHPVTSCKCVCDTHPPRTQPHPSSTCAHTHRPARRTQGIVAARRTQGTLVSRRACSLPCESLISDIIAPSRTAVSDVTENSFVIRKKGLSVSRLGVQSQSLPPRSTAHLITITCLF